MQKSSQTAVSSSNQSNTNLIYIKKKALDMRVSNILSVFII